MEVGDEGGDDGVDGFGEGGGGVFDGGGKEGDGWVRSGDGGDWLCVDWFLMEGVGVMGEGLGILLEVVDEVLEGLVCGLLVESWEWGV